MKLKFSSKQINNIDQVIQGVVFELNEGTPRSGKAASDTFRMTDFYLRSPDQSHLATAYNQEQAYQMFMDGDGLDLVHISDSCPDIWHDGHGGYLLLHAPNGGEKIYYKGRGKINFVGTITGTSLSSMISLEFNLLHKDFTNECSRRTFAAEQRHHLGE